MENYSNYQIGCITKNNRRTMGGWTCYCDFYEITNSEGELIAQVNEELGTVITADGVFQRDYQNEVLPVTLLEVHNKYLLIKVHNLHGTIKKLPLRVIEKGKKISLSEIYKMSVEECANFFSKGEMR